MNKPPSESNGRSKKRPKSKGYAVPRGWVEVASAPNQIAAGMLEGLLKAEGIPVILNRPPTFAYLGVGGVHGVMVPSEREQEARELLSRMWDLGNDGV